MPLQLTKLGTFTAAELDTEGSVTGTIMNNVISAEECYVVQAELQVEFEQITNKFLEQKLGELWDIDDAKDEELRKKGIAPNYLTQGTWQICFVKVGYEHEKLLNEYYQ